MNTSIIHSVAEATAYRDRDDINHSIARLLLQFLNAQSVAIYRLVDDGDAKSVERQLTVTRDREHRAVDTETEKDSGNMPEIDGVPAWKHCLSGRVIQHLTPGGEWSLFPLENARGVTGLLSIEAKAPLAPRDVGLVRGILRILKNHLALLDYGELDTLTGLLNRKTFESKFIKLRLASSTKSARTSESSWLGIVDIDKFKSINDGYGHLFGDEVLLLIAGLMKNNFRGADQLFRFGGEEFIIVLDNATSSGAEIAFERLRTAVAGHRFPQIERVTISLGYTQIHPHDDSSTCVERADAALYYAKHHGRNNARKYEALIETGALTVKASVTTEAELF